MGRLVPQNRGVHWRLINRRSRRSALDSGILVGIAEIAIALAGFTGVTFVFGKNPGRLAALD